MRDTWINHGVFGPVDFGREMKQLETGDVAFGKYGLNFMAFTRDGAFDIVIPAKFHDVLTRKWWKFAVEYEKPVVEFTIAIDRETGCAAISITHPTDHFARKTGYLKAMGRLRGLLSKVKSGNKIVQKKWEWVPPSSRP